MIFFSNSPQDTELLGAALGKLLQPGTVIAYEGDLGAGKTAFTRALPKALALRTR